MNALTCIGLLCLVATVYPQMAPWRSELSLVKPQYFKEVKDLTPLKPPSQTTPTTPSPEQINPYCNNGTCAGVPYETILNSYRGLVFFHRNSNYRSISLQAECLFYWTFIFSTC